MNRKDWIYIILGSLAGGAASFFARLLYKKLKKGTFDKYLKKEEKDVLISEIEEFLRDYDKRERR